MHADLHTHTHKCRHLRTYVGLSVYLYLFKRCDHDLSTQLAPLCNVRIYCTYVCMYISNEGHVELDAALQDW